MNDLVRREVESLKRTGIFAAENSRVIGNNAKAASSFASLKADVAALEAAGVSRLSSIGTKKSGTTGKAAAKTNLFNLVRAISFTANAIAEEATDFDDKFNLPQRTPTYQGLLELARAFAADAVAVSAKFIEYGLPENFVETLNDAVAAAELSADHQNTGKGGSIAANADTEAILKRALQTKRMLKTIVRNIFVDNPAKLAEWESATHVARARETKPGETPPTA